MSHFCFAGSKENTALFGAKCQFVSSVRRGLVGRGDLFFLSLQSLLCQGKGILEKQLGTSYTSVYQTVSILGEKRKPSISKAVHLVPPATTKKPLQFISLVLYTLQSVYCKDVLTSKVPLR